MSRFLARPRRRSRVGARRLAAAAPSLSVIAAACFAGGVNKPLPPAVPVVEVRLDEDSVTYRRPVPAGRVVFQVRNVGESVQRLALVPLPEGFPDIAAQLKGAKRRSADLLARVSSLKPGETRMFAVDLVAGHRYAMVDFSKAPDGTIRGKLGVASEFRTPGRRSQSGTSTNSPSTSTPSSSLSK